MHLELCICHVFTPLDLKTKVSVILHRRELGKPSNTGRLVAFTLKQQQIVIRGREGEVEVSQELINPAFQTIAIFPHDTAVTLTRELIAEDPRPVQLIVPDGSWRQARRMLFREPVMATARLVKLPPGPPSNYRLRHEHLAEGMATFEAISRALGIIEGPDVQNSLEEFFTLVIDRVLSTRGKRHPTI